MPVTVDQPAPYAPASAILELIERHRNKGLPPIVDSDVLLRAGVSDSLVPRTLQALKTLDLITEDGRPSDVFEGIRLAPTSEYRQRLTDWLNSAYADALSYVDPSSDDEISIRDAFRKYIPTGQQGRMVSLFIGLFTAAGVMAPRSKQALGKKPQSAGSGEKATKSRTSQKAGPPTSNQPQAPIFRGSALPPAISGLLATLPVEGGRWTRVRRDQFIATLSAVLDYTFEIGEPASAETETATDQ